MDFLVTYATQNATEIYEHRASNGGVTSGGFYFEWNDEWWKSGWPFKHIGGFEGNVIIANAAFPGCYDDQAWFGLYEDRKNGSGPDPFPRRRPTRAFRARRSKPWRTSGPAKLAGANAIAQRERLHHAGVFL